MMKPRSLPVLFGVVALAAIFTPPAPASAGPATFAIGQPQATAVGASGCGTNTDGEPAIHVSRSNGVVFGSERGLGGGSDGWRQRNGTGGPGASACSAQYLGQPNAVSGVGLAGGDIDLAIAPVLNPGGTYTEYVSSLNLASIAVAHSTDDGITWSNTPVQAGVPIDDREWIAASGPATSLLTYHDVATGNIDVLRSDNSATLYLEIAQAIPLTDYKAIHNQLGNIVIDHRNFGGTKAGGLGQSGFWAYQSFVAPATNPLVLGSTANNEAFVAVSNDGGYSWSDRPIPCSVKPGASLDHQFPNVSVDPAGNLWMAWSDDKNVFAATSPDHGVSWSCSAPVSTNTVQAVFPWLAATSAGVDLVYYGTPTTTNQTWFVYLAQNLTSTATGWGVPVQVTSVHQGPVCEGGATCTGGRQLLDDFGVDTDQSGWAHIAYSHDSPGLGGAATYTGYAIQTGGTQVGFPN